MAMPSGGSIGLKYCVGTTACSSVAQAVDGNQTGNKSLSTLSTTAGKSAPHCMTEFYDYAGSASLCVNPSSIYFEKFPVLCNICICASAGLSWQVCLNASDDTWIRVLEPSGCTGTSNCLAEFGAFKNAGPIRNGTICITSTQPTACIDVTQDGT